MAEIETCSLCPRLCRHACPVAVGTGREAATPTAIAGVLVDHARGTVSDDLARSAATLCVDCGACQDACHLHQPLPTALREVRDALLHAGAMPSLPNVPQGTEPLLLVYAATDPHRNASNVPENAKVVVCPERLGVDHDFGTSPDFEMVGRLFSGRVVYTSDGGIFEVLSRAGLQPIWALTEQAHAMGSCVCANGARPPLACCGAKGPLRQHHPESATLLGRAFFRRLEPNSVLLDTRCVEHLRDCGCAVDSHGVAEKGETV